MIFLLVLVLMGVGLIAVPGAACKRWKALQMYTPTRLAPNREVSIFDTHLANAAAGRFQALKNVLFIFMTVARLPTGSFRIIRVRPPVGSPPGNLPAPNFVLRVEPF
jgi:hypothetical protein